MPFLSDDAKKGMWEQGYNAALGVMKVLESQNPIVETLRKKVQRLLDAENGLPLVFPEVELGFSYGVDGPVGTVREGEHEKSRGARCQCPILSTCTLTNSSQEGGFRS